MPFRANPIKTQTNAHRQERIRNYAHTERRRRQAIWAKTRTYWSITQTLGKRETGKLEASLKKLQQAADNDDMQPIWEFQNKLRTNKAANHVAIKKQDGSECQWLDGTLKGGGNGRKNASAKAKPSPNHEQSIYQKQNGGDDDDYTAPQRNTPPRKPGAHYERRTINRNMDESRLHGA